MSYSVFYSRIKQHSSPYQSELSLRLLWWAQSICLDDTVMHRCESSAWAVLSVYSESSILGPVIYNRGLISDWYSEWAVWYSCIIRSAAD